MKQTIILLAFFIIVTFSHGLFLILSKYILAKENKDKLLLWQIHCWMNGLFWLILLIAVTRIQFSISDFRPSFITQVFGAIFCIIGSIFVVNSFSKLGFKKAMGYRFFVKDKLEWISEGSYSFLQNPMYDGIILVLIGLGLLRGIVADFYIAAESFLLLNLLLASVENKR